MTQPVKIEKYAGQKPTLKIQEFFRGHIDGYAALTDKNTRLVNHLTTSLDAHWHGDNGLLKEVFYFGDGQKKSREWCMHQIDEHHFSLISSLYDGVVSGQQYGNAMHLTYRIKLPNSQNYYSDLHTRNDFFQAINNSPEYMLYSLINTSNIISGVKNLQSLQKQVHVSIKMPDQDIGEYCRQKNKEWQVLRSRNTSYTEFELDNWFYKVAQNIVIQETVVKEHNRPLGQLNGVLIRVK